MSRRQHNALCANHSMSSREAIRSKFVGSDALKGWTSEYSNNGAICLYISTATLVCVMCKLKCKGAEAASLARCLSRRDKILRTEMLPCGHHKQLPGLRRVRSCSPSVTKSSRVHASFGQRRSLGFLPSRLEDNPRFFRCTSSTRVTPIVVVDTGKLMTSSALSSSRHRLPGCLSVETAQSKTGQKKMSQRPIVPRQLYKFSRQMWPIDNAVKAPVKAPVVRRCSKHERYYYATLSLPSLLASRPSSKTFTPMC